MGSGGEEQEVLRMLFRTCSQSPAAFFARVISAAGSRQSFDASALRTSVRPVKVALV